MVHWQWGLSMLDEKPIKAFARKQMLLTACQQILPLNIYFSVSCISFFFFLKKTFCKNIHYFLIRKKQIHIWALSIYHISSHFIKVTNFTPFEKLKTKLPCNHAMLRQHLCMMFLNIAKMDEIPLVALNNFIYIYTHTMSDDTMIGLLSGWRQ